MAFVCKFLDTSDGGKTHRGLCLAADASDRRRAVLTLDVVCKRSVRPSSFEVVVYVRKREKLKLLSSSLSFVAQHPARPPSGHTTGAMAP